MSPVNYSTVFPHGVPRSDCPITAKEWVACNVLTTLQFNKQEFAPQDEIKGGDFGNVYTCQSLKKWVVKTFDLDAFSHGSLARRIRKCLQVFSELFMGLRMAALGAGPAVYSIGVVVPPAEKVTKTLIKQQMNPLLAAMIDPAIPQPDFSALRLPTVLSLPGLQLYMVMEKGRTSMNEAFNQCGRHVTCTKQPYRRITKGWKQLYRKLQIMHFAGYCHNDLHFGNIMEFPGGDILPIDFSLTRSCDKRPRAPRGDDHHLFLIVLHNTLRTMSRRDPLFAPLRQFLNTSKQEKAARSTHLTASLHASHKFALLDVLGRVFSGSYFKTPPSESKFFAISGKERQVRLLTSKE